jgi:phospholipase/carboxylesterase
VTVPLDALVHRLRPARGAPEGALVLFHGRGADENDLFPLFDLLDPDGRLVGVCPRGPVSDAPGGAHWYKLYRVGYPDPPTFRETFATLTTWLEGFADETRVPIDRTVLGGFSQGAVMSYALALGEGRPQPAGLIAFSGFMPVVPDFKLDLADRTNFPVAIGHGTFDSIIGVEYARAARPALEAAGAKVLYRESPMPHSIDPEFIAEVKPWLEARFPG